MFAHLIHLLPDAPDGSFSAEVIAQAEWPFFAGHFPGDPLLPGFAQLGLMLELLALKSVAAAAGQSSSISRLKFTLPVRPGAQLLITAKPGPRGGWDCSVQTGGAVSASARISFQ
jgi:3-hydroxymyristoyl/3-hydroxydecanoyl-(acyl carrier protein) dehydratase